MVGLSLVALLVFVGLAGLIYNALKKRQRASWSSEQWNAYHREKGRLAARGETRAERRWQDTHSWRRKRY